MARASPKDWKVPGTHVHFIDMKQPGCPLYDGTIVSVDELNNTAVVLAVCMHKDYSKEPTEKTFPLDKLHPKR